MSSAFLPYGRHSIDHSDVDAVTAVLRGDWLTTGPEVERFESDLAKQMGGTQVAVLNSGTSALLAAYRVAGLGPGSALLTTPLTFAATATAALHLGADVVFADVEDVSLTLNPDEVAAALDPSIRVVCAVDYAGHPADVDTLASIAEAGGCLLIEDAAHSFGASYKGRPVGSISPVTCFSFHPVKAITTAEGGAVSALDEDFIRAVRLFRSHGMEKEATRLNAATEGPWHQEVQQLGLNLRMPDVLAALGRSQLLRLGSLIDRRCSLAERYSLLLRDIPGLRLPQPRGDCEPAWHLFAVRVLDGRRRQVFEHMRSRGIGVQVHYLPVYRHPLLESLGFKRGSCPVAEAAYAELMSLPLFPDMTEDDQDRVADALREVLV